MTKHNVNIFFQEKTYHKIKDLVEKRKISHFINELVEEKLQKEEKKQKEKLKQQLIKGYQAQARNKKLQKELRAIERTQFEDLKDE